MPEPDYGAVSKRIGRFLSGYVSKSRAKGVVLGLSGGLDSSVVLKLAADALGPSRVLGLVMPASATPKEDVEHAIRLAGILNVRHQTIDIRPVIAEYVKILPPDDDDNNKMAKGNLTARVRMNLLYYHAAIEGCLVAGTSDKSELYIGYFTKYGDGAADILPIANLYKTQVRALAKYLKIPSAIVDKKSSPRLWDNHLAEEELGMGYEAMDPILYLLVDRKLKPKDAAKRLQVPLAQVDKVKEMVDASSHKRRFPETVPAR